MKSSCTVVFAAVVGLASSASAQITPVVGPQVAPLGCHVSISISNDTPSPVATSLCPVHVLDATGATIYAPICPTLLINIAPGDTFMTQWNETTSDGVPVPPGHYTVQVALPLFGIISEQGIEVTSTVVSSVAPLGAPKIGTNRAYEVCAPLDGGHLYLIAASGSSTTGIPTCGGTIPLDADPILAASLSDSGTFQNWFGTLDGTGMSTAPHLAIPNAAVFVGLNLDLATFLLDFSAPCAIDHVSGVMHVTIV